MKSRARNHLQSGVNLIELMIGLVIVGMTLLFGVPSFASWIKSLQVRTAAESIQSGMQVAKSEAIRRNTSVSFVLTSLAAGSSTVDWQVNCFTVTASCPAGIQSRSASESTSTVQVASTSLSTFTFNGLGRLTPVPANGVTLTLTNPSGGSCQPTGDIRCLNVQVSVSGLVRVCDPALPSSNPRGC